MADKSGYIDEEKAKEIAAQIPMEVTGSDGTVAGPGSSAAAELTSGDGAADTRQETDTEVTSGDSAPGMEEKPKDKTSVLGNKTIEDVIAREAVEEPNTTYPFSLSRTLGGVMIARVFQRQIGLVLLVCVFLIIYITNRYVCQKKTVEISKIESKMVEARYKATVCTSILTEKSRESNIMNLLSAYGDSTLTIPKDPPYLIQVNE